MAEAEVAEAEVVVVVAAAEVAVAAAEVVAAAASTGIRKRQCPALRHSVARLRRSRSAARARRLRR